MGTHRNLAGRVIPITKTPFGRSRSGDPVTLYSLENRSGIEACVMTYGATLVRLRTPDRRGELGDIVLGFASVGAYERCEGYLGASIGRYANRIALGRFPLDGRTVTLPCNEYPHHLHGGEIGFDRVVWSAEPQASKDGVALELTRRSLAREEGYPGNLDVTITYTLSDDDLLRIEFRAETDAPTIVNLTNHAYFNLASASTDSGRSILGHELRIDAEWFVPVDDELIPVGELAFVGGTPFDFRTATRIGSRLALLPQRAPRPRGVARRENVREPDHDVAGDVDPQLVRAGGYDHAWLLSGAPGRVLSVAAELHEPVGGRVLTVATTQPGLQFYSGNRLHSVDLGRDGAPLERYAGLCLEAERLPDSPNQPSFPSTELRPGEVYREIIEYRFSVS